MSPWGNFFVIICVQLVVLLALAYRKSAIKNLTPSLLVRSIVAGALFGIVFDLSVGEYLGIFDYTLHFDPLFLLVNDCLSYSIWLLTVQLLQSERLLSFYAWTTVIGLVYEIANYYYPVWSWTFGGSFWYQEGIVVLVAYCGFALLAALASTLATPTRFRIFK
jgi:hypothetical protein